jgi:hypothetical protein
MRNTGIVQKTAKNGIFWSLAGVFLGLLIGIPLMIIAADFAVMGASFMLSFGRCFASPIMMLTSLGMSGIVIL